MYTVMIHATREVKSLHMCNDYGLRMASDEAMLRTHLTGKPHDVVDDYGKAVYTTCKPKTKFWQRYLAR